MRNCDFCGKVMTVSEYSDSQVKSSSSFLKLTEGHYCQRCKKKDIDELFKDVLGEELEIEN